MQYIEPLKLILENRDSLPKPKFNLLDWVILKHEDPLLRDFGIITGYHYDKKFNPHGDAYGTREIELSYYIVFDEESPCRRICCSSLTGDFFKEDEIEKMQADKI